MPNTNIKQVRREWKEKCKHCSQDEANEIKGNGLLIHNKDNFVYLDEKAVWNFIEKTLRSSMEGIVPADIKRKSDCCAIDDGWRQARQEVKNKITEFFLES